MNTTIAFIAVASMNQQKHWQMNVLGQMKMTINSLCLGQQRMVLVTTGDDSDLQVAVNDILGPILRITFHISVSHLNVRNDNSLAAA